MAYLPTPAKVYIVTVVFLMALVFGSGLNCLSYRIAHGQKWSTGRSKCPTCGHILGVRDLVPLFSWLFLKGRCRYCGEKISIRYPLTELTLAVCYVILLFWYDLTLDLAVMLILTACLFCLSLVDMETLIIPNRFLIIPAVCRLAQLLYTDGLRGAWYGLYHALILGGAVLILSLIMDKLLHKESMGGGDIKLLFMLGLFLDLPSSLLLLLIACLVGLVIALVIMRLDRETPFPFGPSISIAAFVTLTVGQSIVNWYTALF